MKWDLVVKKGLVDMLGGTGTKEEIAKELERCLLRRSPEYLILEAKKKPDGKYYFILCIDKKSWENKK